jgi:hypothetical protein
LKKSFSPPGAAKTGVDASVIYPDLNLVLIFQEKAIKIDAGISDHFERTPEIGKRRQGKDESLGRGG